MSLVAAMPALATSLAFGQSASSAPVLVTPPSGGYFRYSPGKEFRFAWMAPSRPVSHYNFVIYDHEGSRLVDEDIPGNRTEYWWRANDFDPVRDLARLEYEGKVFYQARWEVQAEYRGGGGSEWVRGGFYVALDEPAPAPAPDRGPTQVSEYFAWQPWGGSLPGNAIPAGAYQGRATHVCRRLAGDAAAFGQVVDNACRIQGRGRQFDMERQNFDVLVSSYSGMDRWKPWREAMGNAQPFRTPDGRTVHVCRNEYGSGYLVGTLSGSTCSVDDTGSSLEVRGYFDVLMTPTFCPTTNGWIRVDSGRSRLHYFLPDGTAGDQHTVRPFRDSAGQNTTVLVTSVCTENGSWQVREITASTRSSVPVGLTPCRGNNRPCYSLE